MKSKKKSDCDSIPKHTSHSGFSKDNWFKLNSGSEVSVDSIPDVAKQYVEEVKSKGK